MNTETKAILLGVQAYLSRTLNSNDSDISQEDSGKRYSLRETDEQVLYSFEDDTSGDRSGKTPLYHTEMSKAMYAFRRTGNVSALSRVLDNTTQSSFVDCVYKYVRKKNLKETDVYRAAGIDRRLYSKIISDKYYKPSKDTAIAIAMGLKLTLAEANDLLKRSGYSLSHSIRRDVIIEYFFIEKEYDVDLLNSILFELSEKTLGEK